MDDLSADPGADPVVRKLRAEISEVDCAIVEAVNRRLELVARLKRHKDANGIPFLDPDREYAMLESLEEANRGPLSPEGLSELHARLLDLTKREVARDGDEAE